MEQASLILLILVIVCVLVLVFGLTYALIAWLLPDEEQDQTLKDVEKDWGASSLMTSTRKSPLSPRQIAERRVSQPPSLSLVEEAGESSYATSKISSRRLSLPQDLSLPKDKTFVLTEMDQCLKNIQSLETQHLGDISALETRIDAYLKEMRSFEEQYIQDLTAAEASLALRQEELSEASHRREEEEDDTRVLFTLDL